jgi:subtilisin family serine protease
MVHGERLGKPYAVTPATIPQECPNRPVADACPANGLYGLNLIRAPAVWNVLPGIVNERPTVRTMVLDTGVWATHSDLAPNLVPGLSVDFNNAALVPNPPIESDTAIEPEDPTGLPANHGTHVCGTVFARHNNGPNSPAGVVGNALGFSCGCGLNFPDACITRCVEHARTNRARVINMSFGGSSSARLEANNAFRVQVERFCDSGGLIIMAAGNDGQPVVGTFPNGSPRFDYPQTLVDDLRSKANQTIALGQRSRV